MSGKLVFSLLSLALMLAGASAETGVHAQGVPELAAARAEQPPTIDGKLADGEWGGAARATGFLERKSQGLARAQTEVLLLYDDDNLYLAFLCREPNPAGLVARAKDEANFWGAKDDVVAVFIKPDEDEETYYQYALSVSGARFDQKSCPEGGVLQDEYRPGWETAVAIDRQDWQAEISIPFRDIGVGPQMSKTWRVNFLRVRRQTGEVSYWSHTRKSHDTARFGRVRGMIIGARSAGAVLTDISLGERRVGSNVFAATVVSNRSTPLDLKARLTVTSPSGESESLVSEPVAVTGKSPAALEIAYRVRAEEGKHIVVLELSGPDDKLYYRSPPGEVNLDGLLDCYVGRSYYTSEKSARVVCLIEPSVDAAVLKTASVRCALVGTQVAREAKAPLTARTALDLPLAGIDDGEYTVRVMLSGTDGRKIADQDLTLIKLPPGKGGEVKVVRRDKGAYLLVDGEPFFILSNFVCHPKIYDKDVVAEMAEAGFTAAILWGSGKTDEGTRGVLEVGRTHNIKIILSPEHMYGMKVMRKDLKLLVDRPLEGTPDEPEPVKNVRAKLDLLAERLNRYKDHPALLFWRTLDEPSAVNMPQVKVCADFMRSVDPYHPLQLACGPPATGLRHKYRTELDIYGTHYYLHGNKPMIQTFDRARRTKPVADKDRKVYIGILSGVTSGSLRGLTYAEQRCEAYIGLIGGWRGLMWFRGRHHILECWENVKKIAGQVRELAPVLMAEDVKQDLEVTQEPANAGIYWVLLEHEGRRTILAANSKEKKALVSFTVPGLKHKARINVRFEDRQLRSTGDTFRDTFEGFGVHVYEIGE